MARLKRKYVTASTLVPKPFMEKTPGAKVGLITYGSTEAAVREARSLLKQAGGPKTDLMRLRALPFTKEVFDFVKKHERVYIIEANRDGQMRQILSASMSDLAPRFFSAAHSDGLPVTARWVKDTILDQEDKI
jgi:2-oxoglutarate ferredoxin oxidoreductase subunit alpha